jgi:glycosyltransferase involved in cell wall biosynthesis
MRHYRHGDVSAMISQSLRRRAKQGRTAAVTVDVAGGPMGGAARFKAELDRYLQRTGRDDVRVIGAAHRVGPAWLLRREMNSSSRGRYVSINNVSFVASGKERWTLLRNALHFLTDSEMAGLPPSDRTASRREAAVVRLAARRSDVIVTPCTAMADRVTSMLPGLRDRVRVRAHPVSAEPIPDLPRDPAILCPVLFSPYKMMAERLTELLAAIDACCDPEVWLRVTADPAEVPAALASNSKVELVGRLGHAQLRRLQGRSQAIYFPTGIESFGYPLAEARAMGQPVIARDTDQNREIAGPALCGFAVGDDESLRSATRLAMSKQVAPDPGPFDPDDYFDWLLAPAP